jgi:predicted CopG family antitoxin
MCGDPVPNMTLSLPDDVYRIVKTHKEVRWSEIARRAIEDYAKKIALLNTMTARSELTEEEIMAVGKKVKAGIRKHYQRRLSQRTGKKPDSS